jgi:hypothetical protein
MSLWAEILVFHEFFLAFHFHRLRAVVRHGSRDQKTAGVSQQMRRLEDLELIDLMS